jgi:hypothetical protein
LFGLIQKTLDLCTIFGIALTVSVITSLDAILEKKKKKKKKIRF